MKSNGKSLLEDFSVPSCGALGRPCPGPQQSSGLVRGPLYRTTPTQLNFFELLRASLGDSQFDDVWLVPGAPHFHERALGLDRMKDFRPPQVRGTGVELVILALDFATLLDLREVELSSLLIFAYSQFQVDKETESDDGNYS